MSIQEPRKSDPEITEEMQKGETMTANSPNEQDVETAKKIYGIRTDVAGAYTEWDRERFMKIAEALSTQRREITEAGDRLAEAAKNVDRRCLKYRTLPGNRICLTVRAWKDYKEHYCHGCRLTDALSEWEAFKRGR